MSLNCFSFDYAQSIKVLFCDCRDNGWSEEEVYKIIISLQQRGLIKSMEFNSFTRIHHEDTEIKVVKQMPTIASNKQPTIAVITAQYCEKIAVDSMLENKETFVRYTTVGLYTFHLTYFSISKVIPCISLHVISSRSSQLINNFTRFKNSNSFI